MRRIHSLLVLASALFPLSLQATYTYFATDNLQSATNSAPTWFSRVGGGAPDYSGASLRPPLKLHVRISRMQLSARVRLRGTHLKM